MHETRDPQVADRGYVRPDHAARIFKALCNRQGRCFAVKCGSWSSCLRCVAAWRTSSVRMADPSRELRS